MAIRRRQPASLALVTVARMVYEDAMTEEYEEAAAAPIDFVHTRVSRTRRTSRPVPPVCGSFDGAKATAQAPQQPQAAFGQPHLDRENRSNGVLERAGQFRSANMCLPEVGAWRVDGEHDVFRYAFTCPALAHNGNRADLDSRTRYSAGESSELAPALPWLYESAPSNG